MGKLQKGVNDLKTWCLSNGSFGEQLMSEWTGEFDGKKNVDISDVARASNKKAKWKCSKGHEWFATIRHRTNHKSRCPYCCDMTRVRLSEENSLKTWCLSNGEFGKQLMSEWTGEVEDKKNISLDEVSFGSNKKAKWKCFKGHEWFARICDRTYQKQDCPFCDRDERSLKAWCLSNGKFGEQLLSEWTGEVDDKTNINLDEVSFGSAKKAKWRCSKGHEWIARINSRTYQKQGCPYCYEEMRSEIITKAMISEENSLKTWCSLNGSFGEQLMSEWTGEVEGKTNISLDEVARASGKQAKWKCSKGHEWFAAIVSRTKDKTGCPFCNIVSEENNLKNWCLSNGSFGKQLISEWTGEFDGKKNVNLDEVAKASNKKAKWRCSKGHEWLAIIQNRTKVKSGCPFCCKIGTSYPEQFIYHSLKQLYPDAKSRAKAYLPGNNQGIEYDISIVSANLCIEYSPTYWHQGKEDRDNYKKEISRQYNFRLIQIVEDSFDELEHKFEPDYICFKMNRLFEDEILETIVDHILKSLGHSISEIDIEKVKKDAYESCKGIENDIQDTD